MSWLSMLAFYFHPYWLVNHINQQNNTIEHAMLYVKKSIALMVIIVTVLSLIVIDFVFVQTNEKPGEIFAVLLVHGAVASFIVALVAWMVLRNNHQVGILVGWFILVYWIPLWLWNMLFEIYVGFNDEQTTNLFLQLAHDENLMDWHLYLLSAIWVHATAVALLGVRLLIKLNNLHLILLTLLSSAIYLTSFLFIHQAQKGVEILYTIFGMG